MMMMQEDFQDRNNVNINDIDLSLLRLSSPPYDYSRSSFFSAVSPDISPLKRSSPVSEDSDQSKRRRISPQNPIFITSPLRSTYQETDDTNLTASQICCSHARSPVLEKQETSPSASKTPDQETMKMVNNHVEEINHEETNDDTYEEIYRQETNYNAYEEINREETNYENHQQEEKEEEEEDCGEGMRIERSGDGFVIRLKCKCKLAFRVLFADHHLYFKRL